MSARSVIVVWIGLIIAALSASVVPPSVAAQSVLADSVGEVDVYGFVAYFALTMAATDCIRATLALNAIVQNSFDYGCPPAGFRFLDFVAAPLGEGDYTFEIVSTSTSQIHYQRSWSVPAITMTASVSPTSANVSESVALSVVFELVPGGPDAYRTQGALTIDAGSPFTSDVALSLLSARDMDFWTGTATSAYETSRTTVLLSFSQAGSQTIHIQYTDAVHVLTETSSVAVASTTRSEALGLGSVLSIVALLVGLIGIAVGLLGMSAARRALRAVTTPRAPPPMAPSPIPGPTPPAPPMAPTAPPSTLPPEPPPGGGATSPSPAPPAPELPGEP